jgi:hypothetical protein
MEQTHLDTRQSKWLDFLQKEFSDVLVYHFPEIGTGVCVGIKVTGVGNAQFAVSIASEEEILYRYDVAEYYVLNRFYNLATLPMQFSSSWKEKDFNTLGDCARGIAHSIVARY